MNSVLGNLEDPERPFLGPNYWLLKISGLILPENMLAKILYLMIYEIVTLFVATQYAQLYVIRLDLHLVLTLKISMLSVVCIVKVNSFVLWHSKWRDVLEYITIADTFEQNNLDPARKTINNGYTKYCRRITNFYWSLVFVTFLTATMLAHIKYASSHTFRENMRNGTQHFSHVFSSWMPFDEHNFLGGWITVIWHTLLCIYGGFIMAVYDTCIVVVMSFFRGKVDLLRERCKQMFETLEVGISDSESSNIIRQLHGIHTTLIKYSRFFNSVLSPVMFFYLLISSTMLCASAYQLTTTTSAAHKLFKAEYLVFGITQLLMYFWNSNGVLIKDENRAVGTYESKWGAASGRQRKDMLILFGQLRIKNIFTAGPFIDLKLATFIKILKAAYSYYTTLQK